MLNEGADESKIASYLYSVAVESMGPSAQPEKAEEVAAILTDWRDSLKDKYAGSARASA
jgi:hypothetical protein